MSASESLCAPWRSERGDRCDGPRLRLTPRQAECRAPSDDGRRRGPSLHALPVDVNDGVEDSMSETQGDQRSAVTFGARNLGRAVIELLVSDGWAVAGVARSQSTLDGVSAAGALALKADVTDPASVHGVLEQAAAAHSGVELVVNAAAAYGGQRTGPFGGGPIAEADLDG